MGERAGQPRIRTQAPRISPDRDEVRRADRAAEAGPAADVDGGHQREVVTRERPSSNDFISRDPHPDIYERDGARHHSARDSPEFLNRSRRDALKQIRLHRAGRDAARLPHALRRRRFPADAKVIQLDMDATLMGMNRQTDVPLVGNLACSFELLSRK